MRYIPLKRSLLLRLGLTMAVIVILALVGMLSSVFIADTSEGFAAAINQAGTLRMQSYRIASSLVQGTSLERDESIRTTEALVEEFEARLFSPRIQVIFAKDTRPELLEAYQAVERQWQGIMRPILNEFVNRAFASRQGDGQYERITELKMAFLGRVDIFVGDVDHFVNVLEAVAEEQIQLLRLVQFIVLFLTLVMVAFVLMFIQRDVLIPLRDLLASAEAARRGDFSRRTHPRREDELGQLGYAFNLMAADLSKMYTDLERRVADKTADLERSNCSLELLYSTTQQLGEQSLNEAVLEKLLHDIERLLDVRGGAVCLGTSGDDQAFRMASTLPLVEEKSCAGRHCLQCFGAGNAHDVVNISGWQNRYSVPIREQSRQYGILMVELPPHAELSDWQKRLLDSVASHIAMAIVRARQSSQNRLLALMEERSVIARELHDSLAQSLSYLKIQVSRLDKILADAENPKVHEITGKLRDGLNNAYRELRELLVTFRLRISEEGLLQALQDTVDEYRERAGFPIELENHIPNFQFSPNVEIHIVQLIREALSNVVRHANASHALISLRSAADGTMTIMVEDNGRGMPDIDSLEHHHGLPIMRERAKSVGGLLHIGPSELGGTAVRLTFKPTEVSLD